VHRVFVFCEEVRLNTYVYKYVYNQKEEITFCLETIMIQNFNYYIILYYLYLYTLYS